MKSNKKINTWKIKHLRNKMMTALFVGRREVYADENSETRRATNSSGHIKHQWGHWGAA